MSRFDPNLLKILVLQDDVAAPFVLEPLHDLVGRDFFCVRLGNFFVLDRAEIGGTELPETKFLFARGRVNSHRDIHQPKADAAFPDGTHMAGLPLSHTEPCLSIATESGHLPCRNTLPISL